MDVCPHSQRYILVNACVSTFVQRMCRGIQQMGKERKGERMTEFKPCPICGKKE